MRVGKGIPILRRTNFREEQLGGGLIYRIYASLYIFYSTLNVFYHILL